MFILAVEMLFKRSFLFSNPCFIRIEVSPCCNLSCPGCLLGGANYSESNPAHRKEKMMSLELFKESAKNFFRVLLK